MVQERVCIRFLDVLCVTFSFVLVSFKVLSIARALDKAKIQEIDSLGIATTMRRRVVEKLCCFRALDVTYKKRRGCDVSA